MAFQTTFPMPYFLKAALSYHHSYAFSHPKAIYHSAKSPLSKAQTARMEAHEQTPYFVKYQQLIDTKQVIKTS